MKEILTEKVYRVLLVLLITLCAISSLIICTGLHVYNKWENIQSGTYVGAMTGKYAGKGYVIHEIQQIPENRLSKVILDDVHFYVFPEDGGDAVEKNIVLFYDYACGFRTGRKIAYFGENLIVHPDTYFIAGKEGTIEVRVRVTEKTESNISSDDFLYQVPTPDSPTILYPFESEQAQLIMKGGADH